MPDQVANSLVLRSDQGGTFSVVPTTDGRLSIEVTSSSNMLQLPLTIAQDLDRGCTTMIRDFLSAWLDQHNVDQNLIGDRPMNYKVGDKVSVVDLRDGAIVERETTITALETVTLPGKSEPTRMASLACGYGVSVRCLQPVA